MRDKDSGWVEADVTINGHELSFAESMVLRVAVSSMRMYASNLENAKGLGMELATNYDVHLGNIEAYLQGTK